MLLLCFRTSCWLPVRAPRQCFIPLCCIWLLDLCEDIDCPWCIGGWAQVVGRDRTWVEKSTGASLPGISQVSASVVLFIYKGYTDPQWGVSHPSRGGSEFSPSGCLSGLSFVLLHYPYQRSPWRPFCRPSGLSLCTLLPFPKAQVGGFSQLWQVSRLLQSALAFNRLW